MFQFIFQIAAEVVDLHIQFVEQARHQSLFLCDQGVEQMQRGEFRMLAPHHLSVGRFERGHRFLREFLGIHKTSLGIMIEF